MCPIPTEEEKPRVQPSTFQPTQPKHRKPSAGGIYQLNGHLGEGKYSPRDAQSKHISRNVFAHTREECESKLAAMIEEVKKEVAMEREGLRTI